MTDQTGAPSAVTPGGTPAASGGPPEGLPSKYWDAATGTKWGDYLKDSLPIITAHAAREASLPIAPENYKAELPPDFQGPKGVEVKIDEKDPRLPLARTIAHELKLGQDGFSKLLAADAQMKVAELRVIDAAVRQEQAKLGENFEARKTAVESFLEGRLGKGSVQVLPSIRTAAQFEMIEKLIAMATATGAARLARL